MSWNDPQLRGLSQDGPRTLADTTERVGLVPASRVPQYQHRVTRPTLKLRMACSQSNILRSSSPMLADLSQPVRAISEVNERIARN